MKKSFLLALALHLLLIALIFFSAYFSWAKLNGRPAQVRVYLYAAKKSYRIPYQARPDKKYAYAKPYTVYGKHNHSLNVLDSRFRGNDSLHDLVQVSRLRGNDKKKSNNQENVHNREQEHGQEKNSDIRNLSAGTASSSAFSKPVAASITSRKTARLLMLLHDLIQEQIHYPVDFLASLHKARTVYLGFTLLPNGYIEDIKILKSSGIGVLDQEARRALFKIQPVALAQKNPHKKQRLQVWVRFV